MRKIGAALLVSAALLVGCSSTEEKPSTTGTKTTDGPPAATTRDVTVSLKNDTKENRVVWVETYHPEKGSMSGQPDTIVQLGTLAPGDSLTKTIPVAERGWYRVIGAKPQDAEKDKVVFMGRFTRIKDQGDEPPVHVDR